MVIENRKNSISSPRGKTQSNSQRCRKKSETKLTHAKTQLNNHPKLI